MPKPEASMEALVELGILPITIFHPGGATLTRELLTLAEIGEGSRVLDVACGVGETACLITEAFGARVVGIDATLLQIERAKSKAADRGLGVDFQLADAHELPFDDDQFDLVMSEAVLCYLDIPRALSEMVRVTRPGGAGGNARYVLAARHPRHH